MAVYGAPVSGTVPHLVKSQVVTKEGAANLLSVLFETNPLDKSCDQRVKLEAR